MIIAETFVKLVSLQLMSPVHWAAFHNRPEHLHLLLERGGDVMATDTDGKMALHWAAQVRWKLLSEWLQSQLLPICLQLFFLAHFKSLFCIFQEFVFMFVWKLVNIPWRALLGQCKSLKISFLCIFRGFFYYYFSSDEFHVVRKNNTRAKVIKKRKEKQKKTKYW